MGSYFKGVRKCLINHTNGITENITTITWMLGVGGTSSRDVTVTVPHSVKMQYYGLIAKSITFNYSQIFKIVN